MLSNPINALLERLKGQKFLSEASSGEALINVNKITEKAGAAYEKIRYLVDYKDDRHIRRSAIERIIKRKIIFEKGEDIGFSLVQELIAGRYLANNTIPERATREVDRIIFKYKLLERHLPATFREDIRVRNILVSLIGTEIEEFFFPNNEDDFVAEAFYATIKDSVKVEGMSRSDMMQTQILIACYRSLFNTDDETLRYKLWQKLTASNWPLLYDEIEIKRVAEASPGVWEYIRHELNDPLSFRLLPKLYNDAIYFSVVREVIRAYGAESGRIFEDHEALTHFTEEFLEKNYQSQYAKTRSSAIRAVLYVFLTKSLLALAVEVPYQVYILGGLEYFPIATNIIFHPLLLFTVTMSTKPLGEENTKAIETGVHNVLSGENIRPIKINLEQTGLFNSLFIIIYAALFFIVFGIIVFILQRLYFSAASILLFMLFLALISYFALRIRHSANRWKVAKEDDRFVTVAFNIFALPIVRAGRWLSRRFSSINVFVFVMDFIIETPFKMLLHFSDAFVSFLKEKQQDVN
ncbi:hypothetical protein KGQ31_00235 [Patescibacteria group bacterium]|nr:hypothetical protein [Patescibacteria group bacterium]